MSPNLDYRELAEEQRRKAQETPLLMVRLRHLVAAEKWELLAGKCAYRTCDTPAGQLPESFR